MVRYVKSEKPMYLVFDAIAVNGSPCGHEPLSKRLEVIRKTVIEPYRKAVESSVIPQIHPFILIGKPFFEKTKIKNVLECIKLTESGERYYIDQRRHHKTDGLIFTPDRPYQPKTTQ